MSPDGAVRLPQFLIRQPLLDAHYKVVGHEFSLRERVPVELLPGAAGLEQARDEHLITSVVDMASRHLLGGQLILLDLAASTLDNPILAQLPQDRVGITLSASMPGLAARSAALVEAGLLPILDDDSIHPPVALPPGCKRARLDCGRRDALTLGEQVEHLRRLGTGLLIAGNVDSEETFEVCRKLAFDIYQGGFLGQPRTTGTHKLNSGVMQVMELLNLTREQAPIERMEAVFKHNAALTYRLLRYINSPANGLGRAMQSIGQALMWLGHEPLYRWLTLLLFGEGDGRNAALLKNALVRARFMENLGVSRLDPGQRGGLFIVGILSHLDTLLNQPLNQAIEPLRLPDAMREALLDGQGLYAPYLHLVRACEHFDQEAVQALASAHGLDADVVNLAHVNALIWSESLEP